MSTAIRELKTAIRTLLINQDVLAEFPEQPPDMLVSVPPTPVLYTTNQRWTHGTASRGASRGDAGARQGLITVILELHIPSAMPSIPQALDVLEPFEESVPDAFFIGWKSGFLKNYAMRFIELRGRIDDLGPYGDEDTFGWRWEADFELEVDVPRG